MSEHKTRNYEARCLLEILACFVAGEEVPRWNRQMDWGEVYKLADYHNVANDVYYKLMASEEKELLPWKKKFEERFHEASAAEDRYKDMLEAVLVGLERHKIPSMVLKDFHMRKFYPRLEMRALDEIAIQIEPGKKEVLHALMKQMDFEQKERRQDSGLHYYKIPGMNFVFFEQLEFTGKKMKAYYNVPSKLYPKVEGFRYIHEMETDDFYLYIVGTYAENYARGRLEIREMLDFWYYYLGVYSTLDWDYIRKILVKINLEKFGDNLVKLAAFWFAGMSFPAELELFRGMEEYILTKGIKGRKESAQLLPLVKEVADFYKRDLKKERRKQQLKWIFPAKQYMEVLFPFLQKRPNMIYVCWGLRIFRSFYFTSRNKLIDMKIDLSEKFKTKKQKLEKKIMHFHQTRLSLSEGWREFRRKNLLRLLDAFQKRK